VANSNPPIDISVIVPVYNAERFILECLNSIIEQDFESLEVLVSDDCSSDSTRLVLDQFRDHDCIKIFYQPKNLGITKNCNFLLQQAKGKYICFFAGDDVMLPTKLHKQFLFMERNPHCSFCYHKIEILRTYPGQVVNTTKLKAKPPLKDAADIIKKMGVPGSMSMMVKASSIPDRMFSENYNYVSDWLMQIDLALDGDIGFINEFLCQYRNFGDNNGKDISGYEHEFISLLEYVETEYPLLTRACKEGRARYLLGSSFREGRVLRRREILKESVNLHLTLISGFLLIVCYVPFIGRLFAFVYSKRMVLKKYI
jgi:glycosyltransferase involved in cell wall biosynthesis